MKKITKSLTIITLTLIITSSIWICLKYYYTNQLYWYDRQKNFHFSFDTSEATMIPVSIQDGTFSWPDIDYKWDTCFLELDIESTLAGALWDPNIEISTPQEDSIIVQYFSPGADGIRYLNLSSFASHPLKNKGIIHLKGNHITLKNQTGRLILFQNNLSDNDPILIIAPHPDDAEIAAYGLYSNRNSTIVTITAGDRGGHLYQHLYKDQRARALMQGKLRILDSIAVGMMAGIPENNIVNLGFFDSTLTAMHDKPNEPVKSPTHGFSDTAIFRQYTPSPLLRLGHTESNWNNLIEDLVYILNQVKPKVIVTPHPLLDSHHDHQLATVAVIEALKKTDLKDGDLFLYTNHHVFSEVYPYGAIYSTISLPPWFDDTKLFSKIYSHPLNSAKQKEKVLALDMMHDFRLPPLTDQIRTRAMRKLFIQAMGINQDHSYFRRSVRSNELFFVIPYSEGEKLIDIYFDEGVVKPSSWVEPAYWLY